MLFIYWISDVCSADFFPFTVQFGDAPAFVRPDLDACNVAEPDGCSIRGFEDYAGKVGRATQVSPATDHEFGFGHFDDPAAGIPVALPDRLGNTTKWNAAGLQLSRIGDPLLLISESAGRPARGDAPRLGPPKELAPLPPTTSHGS